VLPPRLAVELEALKTVHPVEVQEGQDFIEVIVSNVPTSGTFNCPATTVLIRVPRAYPDAGLDMFWTDPGLILADGQIPQAANSMEQYAGRMWRRFSWHHNGWNPTLNNLHTYMEFVRRRFRDR
jgi:hypothetical protein